MWRPKTALGPRIVEDALRDHKFRAALLARGRPFLGGLEDEHEGARDVLAHSGEHRGHAVLHRGVDVMSAGVHHADLLSVVSGAHFRRERQIGVLGDGQGVHVGAHRHHRSRLPALQDPDHAGVGDPFAHLVEPEFPEVFRHHPRGLELAVPEFGMLVDVLAESDRFRFETGHRFLDAVVPDPEFLGRGRRRQADKEGESGDAVKHGDLR